MTTEKLNSKDEMVIFRPYITVNGKRIWAKDYGHKAFRIVIKKK